MTILEGNKLIAEFMGFSRTVTLREGVYKVPEGEDLLYKAWHLHIDKMPYHSSWDWLMPVAEKIYLQRSVNDVIIRLGKTIIELKDGLIFSSPCLPENNSIIECWHCLLQFIQWYNSQSKTDPNG